MDYVDALEVFLEGLKRKQLSKEKPKNYEVFVLGKWTTKYRVLKERKKRKKGSDVRNV